MPFTTDPFEDSGGPSLFSLPTLPKALDPKLSASVLSRLPSTGEYNLDGIDYVALFTAFKVLAYTSLKKERVIYLESLEHTIFLKPGSYSKEMISLSFGSASLDNLRKALLDDYFQSDVSTVNPLVAELYTVMDEFAEPVNVKIGLKSLKKKHNSPEARRIISCLKELLNSLTTIKEKVPVINETDLKTRYIHPTLKYFGNDAVDEEFTLCYPETSPTERKLHKDEAQRPDAIISTTLILPIKAVLQPSAAINNQHPRNTSQLKSRKKATILQDVRRTSNKILKQIKTNTIQWQSFFKHSLQPHQDNANLSTGISFSPFTDSLYFNNQQDLDHPVSTRTFRKACTDAYTSKITSFNWKRFWSLSLNLVNHNVIYRYITRTIPTKRLLFFFKIVDSPLCPICRLNENADHLLFLCPSKVSIWKDIIFEFLWPTVSVDDIIQACRTLDFTDIQYVSKPYTIADIVILVTLGNIWRAHVRMVFDSAPFQWHSVVNQIKEELLHLHAPTELHEII